MQRIGNGRSKARGLVHVEISRSLVTAVDHQLAEPNLIGNLNRPEQHVLEQCPADASTSYRASSSESEATFAPVFSLRSR
jgi:hypothetical protein